MLSLPTAFSATLKKAGMTVTALAALMFAALTQSAQAQNYTFEGQTATSGAFTGEPGSYTSLVLTNSGITATLTRENNETFDIYNTNSLNGTGASFPASWGNRSLDPFSNLNNSAFIMTFSAPVDFARVAFGDFGGDSDSFILQAFSGLNGSGTLLGTDNESYAAGSLPNDVGVGSVTASGIQSIRFIGGSTNFPNSVFYDNIAVRASAVMATPEPASYTAFMLGGFALVGLGLTARKRQVIA